MNPNRKLFDQFCDEGTIRVRRGSLFSQSPGPLPPGFDFDRVEGMMLGLAVGDALGNTSESMKPSRRKAAYGEIRDYRGTGGRGYPSDDSQLAFRTLERLVNDGGFIPERVAKTFTDGHIDGIGRTVTEFLVRWGQGLPWHRCGPNSAGNGALMRIAPILIPHLHSPSEDLWIDSALCAMITHNSSAAIASSVAFIKVLWQLLGMSTPPPADWWVSEFVSTLKDLECEGGELEPRSHAMKGFRGSLWQFLEVELPKAYAKGSTALEACERWRSGAFLLETVPCVLYILMRHARDPEKAIVRAINDTHDNDTVAAIVGAAVGALHGRRAFPKRWLDRLSGRVWGEDDDHAFRLLDQARKLWG